MADGMALIKANPKSDAAFEALNAILSLDHTLPEALQLMAEHHAANPGIGPMIALLSYYRPHSKHPAHAPATNLRHAVATQNPDRTARGQAYLGLAWLKKGMFDRTQSNPAEMSPSWPPAVFTVAGSSRINSRISSTGFAS